MDTITPDERRTVESLLEAVASPQGGPDLEMVHPEVVWAPAGPALRGRSQVRDWLRGRDRCPIEVSELFRVDCWVIALCTAPRPAAGEAPVPLAWAFHIADGLVVGAHGYSGWDEALDFAGAWANAGAARSKVRSQPARWRLRPAPGVAFSASRGRPAGAS